MDVIILSTIIVIMYLPVREQDTLLMDAEIEKCVFILNMTEIQEVEFIIMSWYTRKDRSFSYSSGSPT